MMSWHWIALTTVVVVCFFYILVCLYTHLQIREKLEERMVLAVDGLFNIELLVNDVVAGKQENWLLNADPLDDFVVELMMEFGQVEEYVLDNVFEIEKNCLMMMMIYEL